MFTRELFLSVTCISLVLLLSVLATPSFADGFPTSPEAEEVQLFEDHLTRLEEQMTFFEQDPQGVSTASGDSPEIPGNDRAALAKHLDLFEFQTLRLGPDRSAPLLERIEALRERLATAAKGSPDPVDPSF